MTAAWRDPNRVVTKAICRLSSDGRPPEALPRFSRERKTSGSGSSGAFKAAPASAAKMTNRVIPSVYPSAGLQCPQECGGGPDSWDLDVKHQPGDEDPHVPQRHRLLCRRHR